VSDDPQVPDAPNGVRAMMAFCCQHAQPVVATMYQQAQAHRRAAVEAASRRRQPAAVGCVSSISVPDIEERMRRGLCDPGCCMVG
jgi:hypothetical protein